MYGIEGGGLGGLTDHKASLMSKGEGERRVGGSVLECHAV